MTFSLPESLAAEFVRTVAARDRSQFVSEAIAASLGEREAALIRACEMAGGDLDVEEIERNLTDSAMQWQSHGSEAEAC